jgi:hypothetical protein
MFYILKRRAHHLLVWNNAPPHNRRLSPIHKTGIGPRSEPCGTPSLTFWYLEEVLLLVFRLPINVPCGPGSSVGIATGYGLDGPRIESGWRRDFSHTSRTALRPTQPPVQWVPGLSQGWCGRGVRLTTHPLLVPRSRKSRSIPLPTLWACSGLQRDCFTFLLMFPNILV